RFWIGCALDAAVLLLIERVGEGDEVGHLPAATGVANDSEEPCARVSARERPEVSQRAQRRFLHGILGVVLISHEPACQTIGGIEMGQNDLVETLTDLLWRGGHTIVCRTH